MRSSIRPMLVASLGQAAAMTLSAQLGLASPQGQSRAEAEAEQVAPTRTGKERLGGKASDEQRVDNCNVPFDLRGPKPRPDDCGAGASTSTGR